MKLPGLLSRARHRGDPMYAEREKWSLRMESLGLTPQRARAREAQRWAMWQALCRDEPSLRVSDVDGYADFNRPWFEAQWRPGRARQPHSQVGAASHAAPVSVPAAPSEASQIAPGAPGRASQDGPRDAQTPVVGGLDEIGGPERRLAAMTRRMSARDNGEDGLGGSIAATAAAAIREGERNVRSFKMRAIYRHDWNEALEMMRRPNRLPALWRWFHTGKITAAELNGLLGSFWPRTEGESRRPEEHWLWLSLFRDAGFVTDGAELPSGDPLTIYRGQGADHLPGLSWTLDREQAEWFARRFTSPAPAVLTGGVARSNVLGYFADRDEAEIVVDPADVAIAGRALL